MQKKAVGRNLPESMQPAFFPRPHDTFIPSLVSVGLQEMAGKVFGCLVLGGHSDQWQPKMPNFGGVDLIRFSKQAHFPAPPHRHHDCCQLLSREWTVHA